MSETQKSISDWADETFGRASTLRMIGRANTEMAELVELGSRNVFNKLELANEMADVYITLARIAEMIGIDLQGAVNSKMAVNRSRRWLRHGDGTGQHIKE